MYRKHQQENKLLLAYIKTKERLRSLQFIVPRAKPDKLYS